MNGDVGQKEGAKLFALFLMISVNVMEEGQVKKVNVHQLLLF